MNDEKESSGSSHAVPWTVAAFLFLPVLYVLSVGPAIYFMKQSGPTPGGIKFFETFYQPLTWLHDHTPLKRPIERYAKWWYELD